MAKRTFVLGVVLIGVLSSACQNAEEAASPTTVAGLDTTETATTLATQAPTPSSTRTPRPTPEPTPPPPPIEELLLPAPDALVHREYAEGELIDLEQGIFLMDVATGSVEAWSLPAIGMRTTGYRTTDDGRFVLAGRTGPDGAEQYLVDRGSGTTFGWRIPSGPPSVGTRALRLVAGPDDETGLAIFRVREERRPRTLYVSYLVQFESGTYTVARELPPFPENRTVLLAGADRAAYWVEGPADDLQELMRMDLDTGTVAVVAEEVSGRTPRLAADGETVELLGTRIIDDVIALTVLRYDIDSERVARFSVPLGRLDPSGSSLSPDGRTLAWASWLPYGLPDGVGGTVDWGPSRSQT